MVCPKTEHKDDKNRLTKNKICLIYCKNRKIPALNHLPYRNRIALHYTINFNEYPLSSIVFNKSGNNLNTKGYFD